jgi:hypothetical protein
MAVFYKFERILSAHPLPKGGHFKDRLAPHERLVLEPRRRFGVDAELGLARFFVGREIAFEVRHLRVTLESEDMGGQAIEKPAIMRDHHHATRKAGDGLFEVLQGIDIEVIGGFVK